MRAGIASVGGRFRSNGYINEPGSYAPVTGGLAWASLFTFSQPDPAEKFPGKDRLKNVQRDPMSRLKIFNRANDRVKKSFIAIGPASGG